jgi:hypothetical protein
MSIPPPPQHPPPRRQPQAAEDPSLTTQIFLDQAKAATAGAAGPEGTDGGDGGQGATAGAPQGAQRSSAPQPPRTPDPVEETPAQESTQMMSMEELRALAASSHIDEIDGPREQQSAASASWATRQDDERAQSAAPPGVFTPVVRQAQSHGPGVPPPPQAPPPHAQQYAAAGAPTAAGYASGPMTGQPPGQSASGRQNDQTVPGQQQASRKRGLPVLAIVFVVLSALVVLGIGGWILVDALGRSGEQSQQPAPPPPPATSTTDPGGLVDEGENPTADAGEDVETFTTPSGNIGCTIDAERARCVITTFDYDPPEAPDGCTMDEWGSIVVANSEGAGFSCSPAQFPADGQALDYGQTVSAHGMTCESSESGVTCRSEETDSSFSVARASADFTQR